MKKIRIFTFFILLCLLLTAAAPPAWALEPPEMTARAWILVDLNTGEVVAEHNADEQRSPASLTKIMTGLLAVEAVENGEIAMEDIVTAGMDCQNGMDSSSSNVSIVAGEQMRYQDFFYCAMLASANDACNVLGSRLSGSIGGFVERMNARASELGLEHTHFEDPHGLSYNNVTTARELSRLLQEALRHEAFAAAFTSTTYTVEKTNANEKRELKSTDALTTRDSYYSQYGDYYYEYALGGKTGFTKAAGYCLASVAEKDDLKLLAVVMGCPGPLTGDSKEPENFRDTIRLYDWAFANFAYGTVLSSSEIITRVPVEDADGEGYASLRCHEDLRLLLPADAPPESRRLEITLLEERFTAPIPAGTILGSLTLHINGQSFGPYELVNMTEVKLAKKQYILKQVNAFFARRAVRVVLAVLAVILVLYLALVMRYRALRRRHLREQRRAEQRRKAAREAQQRRQAEQPVQAPPAVSGVDDIDLSRFFEDEANK